MQRGKATDSAWSLDTARLVELDMGAHGPRFIVVEFGVGVAGCAVLGFLSLRAALQNPSHPVLWQLLLGLELALIALNYMPLLLLAVAFRRDPARIEAARASIRNNPQEARSYGLRQVWILVPVAVVLFALRQRSRA